MKLRQTATAVTIGSFAVVFLTGALLFADLGIGGIRATHEWIGILFAGSGVVHLLTHKKSFYNYFKTARVIVIVGTLLAGGVIYATSFNDIYGSAVAFDLLSNADMKTLCAVLQRDPGFVSDQLQSMGLAVDRTDMTMVEIAQANKIDIHDIMDLLFQSQIK